MSKLFHHHNARFPTDMRESSRGKAYFFYNSDWPLKNLYRIIDAYLDYADFKFIKILEIIDSFFSFKDDDKSKSKYLTENNWKNKSGDKLLLSNKERYSHIQIHCRS